MATTLTALIAQVRTEINEPTASYWTDAELLVYAIDGVKDLWKAVKAAMQDHFFTIIESVTMDANTKTLTGLPADLSEVRLIEPYDLTTYPALVFLPKKYNDPEFQNARTQQAINPGNMAGVIYYAITGAGGPVAAPVVYVAPLLSSQITLRIMYVPNLGAMTGASVNPIPGESDYAVKCWVKAQALGRQNQDGLFEPDAAWMELYGNEKQKIQVDVAPRQTQEPETVDALFEALW